MEIFEVISSVLNGQASFEEKEIFENWISESHINKKTYDYLSRIRHERNSEQIKWDKEKVWQITQNKIKESRFRKILFMWRSIAASIAVTFLISSALYYSNYKHIDQVAQISTNTPYGILTVIELPDGSVVHLNSGSELNYPSFFTGKERKVKLSGEAYFEVVKDSEHPFIVSTGEMNIKVLGTKFNVLAYPDNSDATTTLLEGSVRLRNSKDTTTSKDVILRPNHKAIFNKQSGNIQIKTVDDALAYISWKDGHYYFEDEQFSSIVKKLERGFNVKIIVNFEKLKHEKYSGMFDNRENIYEILNIMKLNRGFDYYTSQDTIHIIKKSMSNLKK